MPINAPLLTLVTGIACTLLAWSGLSYVEHQNAEAEFKFETDKIQSDIRNRLGSYEELLTGVKAFFMASSEVNLQEWRIYFDKLRFDTYYPGLQGIAYVQRIKSAGELEDLKARLRGYGMTDFSINPEGDRGEYFPVVFLEPLDEKNAKAVGYDIYSEETRRITIDSAKNTESTAITSRITLKQEEGETNIQSGLLLMVPFFTNERIDHQDAFRELDGIIDGVIRMGDFIRAIIEPAFLDNIHLRIYDQHPSRENLLFDSLEGGKPGSFPARFSSTVDMNVYNRNWVLELEGQPAANFLPLFFGKKSRIVNLAVLIAGCGLSCLGFFIARGMQAASRLKKEKLADLISLKASIDIIRRQEETLLVFGEHSKHVIACIIDIKDSTALAARLSGAESAEFYGTFHNMLGSIIASHGGTTVKTMGDAILYYFNASSPPTTAECTKAIDCCLEMIQANGELNRILRQKALPGIVYRISAVFGSVMSASKNGIHDIFGSTVNQCSKINRHAGPNGLVVCGEIQGMLSTGGAYKITESAHALPVVEGCGVYHVSAAR